ncbi:MAG: hypothetical protein ACLP05_05990 [Candidatus Kryptoniota bacterium]
MASFKRLLLVVAPGKVLDTAFRGESVRQSIDSVIGRLAKVGARVVYHAPQGVGYSPAASPFP